MSHLAGSTLTPSNMGDSLCVEPGPSRSAPASTQAKAPQPSDPFTPQPGTALGHGLCVSWDVAKKTIIIPHLVLAVHFVLSDKMGLAVSPASRCLLSAYCAPACGKVNAIRPMALGSLQSGWVTCEQVSLRNGGVGECKA